MSVLYSRPSLHPSRCVFENKNKWSKWCSRQEEESWQKEASWQELTCQGSGKVQQLLPSDSKLRIFRKLLKPSNCWRSFCVTHSIINSHIVLNKFSPIFWQIFKTNTNRNTHRDAHERWHSGTVRGLQRSGMNQTEKNWYKTWFPYFGTSLGFIFLWEPDALRLMRLSTRSCSLFLRHSGS